jgi:hypothetical protein
MNSGTVLAGNINCARQIREGACTDMTVKAQRNALSAVFQLSMRLRVSPQARQPNVSRGSNSRAPAVSYYEQMAMEMTDERG